MSDGYQTASEQASSKYSKRASSVSDFGEIFWVSGALGGDGMDAIEVRPSAIIARCGKFTTNTRPGRRRNCATASGAVRLTLARANRPERTRRSSAAASARSSGLDPVSTRASRPIFGARLRTTAIQISSWRSPGRAEKCLIPRSGGHPLEPSISRSRDRHHPGDAMAIRTGGQAPADEPDQRWFGLARTAAISTGLASLKRMERSNHRGTGSAQYHPRDDDWRSVDLLPCPIFGSWTGSSSRSRRSSGSR